MIRLPFWDTWSIFKVFAVSFRKRRIVYNNTSSESSLFRTEVRAFQFSNFVGNLDVRNFTQSAEPLGEVGPNTDLADW